MPQPLVSETSHVLQLLSDRAIIDKGIKIRAMILPDTFIDQDVPEKMYEKAGLNAEAIEEKELETLKSNIVISKTKKFK